MATSMKRTQNSEIFAPTMHLIFLTFPGLRCYTVYFTPKGALVACEVHSGAKFEILCDLPLRKTALVQLTP